MAWRALALSDIQTGLSAKELDAVQQYALQPGQTDPVPYVITASMDEVRGYIAGSRLVALGAEGTIPDKLIDCAIRIAVWQLVKRFPTKLLATEARRQDYQDAIRLLKDVAADKFRVEIPVETTTEVIAGVPRPQFSHYGVRFRVHREQQEMM